MHVNRTDSRIENFYKYVDIKGLRNKDIVDKTGEGKGNVSSYLNKIRKPSENFLKTFESAYGVDLLENINLNPVVSQSKGRPYYDVDFLGGFDLVLNDQTIHPSFYIDFMPFNDVDCWVNITGKSMSPFISHGDIVALKRINNWDKFLLFGEIYAVITDEFRTVKIVSKSEDKDCFKLIPYSKSPEFSEQDIPKEMIKAIYRVKGSLKRFF